MERGNKNRGAHRSLGTPLVVVFYAYNAMEILYDALRHHIKDLGFALLRRAVFLYDALRHHVKDLGFASLRRAVFLYDALRHHIFSHLHEAGNVGAFHVVYVAVGLGAVLHAVLVDVFHDGVEACVYFFGGP